MFVAAVGPYNGPGIALWRLRPDPAPLLTIPRRAEEASWNPHEYPVAITPGAARVLTGARRSSSCDSGPGFEVQVREGTPRRARRRHAPAGPAVRRRHGAHARLRRAALVRAVGVASRARRVGYSSAPMSTPAPPATTPPASAPGRFGPFGGRYVSETLIPSLDELTAAWAAASADPRLRRGAVAPADRLRRAPDAARLRRAPVRRGREGSGQGRAHLPQARGPLPHGRAQDQQLHRSGAAGAPDGQDAHHRRDRRRPARRRDRDRVRAVRAARARSTWARSTSSARA